MGVGGSSSPGKYSVEIELAVKKMKQGYHQSLRIVDTISKRSGDGIS